MGNTLLSYGLYIAQFCAWHHAYSIYVLYLALGALLTMELVHSAFCIPGTTGAELIFRMHSIVKNVKSAVSGLASFELKILFLNDITQNNSVMFWCLPHYFCRWCIHYTSQF